MKEKDINALQGIVNVLADLLGETVDNLADGKISKLELMGYTDNVIPLVNAIMDSPEAVAEIKAGIDAEERAALVAGLKEHFDIENDELEVFIEDIVQGVLEIAEGTLKVVGGIKAIRNMKD